MIDKGPGTLLGVLPVLFLVGVLIKWPLRLGQCLSIGVEELTWEMSWGWHFPVGAVAFALGFTRMMVLDVARGYE